jgi:hypothetical protein
MANETLLVLSGPGVQPYSARGLKQTLTPIGAAANNRRTINGDLLDLSQQQFRKYASTISCSDQLAPALDGVWPGLVLTVDCVAELAYKTVGGTPARTVVSGSSRTDGAYTFYRPRLTMRVMNYNMDEDEYGRVLAWSLELEEA